jgi:hypothetical protein
MNLCQLLSQTNVDINALIQESESVVAPNDVLDSAQYIPVTTSAPVLHYLEPKSVESIALNVITTNTSVIDSHQPSMAHFSSPTHSSHSYSPALSTINQTYLSPTPSPALSYASSSAGSPSTLVSMDAITSDSNATIEGVFVDSIDMKPDLDFLQPTVINDHLYTLPSTSTSTETGPAPKRRKSGADHKDKYTSVRRKNNVASKKSRVTKRDKQKQMEDQIQHYKEDNENCKKRIEQMEREIEWCKNYLFKKVVASARN